VVDGANHPAAHVEREAREDHLLVAHRQRLNELCDEKDAAEHVALPDDVSQTRFIQLVLLPKHLFHRLIVALLDVRHQLKDPIQHQRPGKL